MISSTFISGKGPWYIFDPRAKLILVLLLCIEVFLPLPVWGIYLIFSITMLTAFGALGFRQALVPLKTVLPLILIMALFVPFTYRSSPVLIQAGPVVLATRDSLAQFFTHTGRFLSITYLTTMFVWTTRMNDIMLTFRWFGLPYPGALVITLTFRFIPFIADTFSNIEEAHSLRQPEQGSSRRWKVFDMMPTISCTLIYALKSIPQLAMNLEHRGFSGFSERSSYRSLSGGISLFTHLLISVMIASTFLLLLIPLG